MSKTTTVLILILFLFLGVLLFVMMGIKQNPIIMSLTKPLVTHTSPVRTSLSFATHEEPIIPGQALTVPVIIHNPDPRISVIQLELAYDPTILTVTNISPGTFFTKPAVALQNIDPVTGRISYALHCPTSPFSNKADDCVNPSSSTIATLTIYVTPYAVKNKTVISFFPKTAIRTRDGVDLLQKTSGLQLILSKPSSPVASSSAVNQFPPITATHSAERK